MATIEGKMNWLVTGGSGQLAIALNNLLESEGQSYTSPSRNDLDISSLDAIEKIVAFNPDVIVNCAAYTLVDRAEFESELAFKVNRDGARNLALAARELDVPLIHISTDYVFSGTGNSPWKTTDFPKPSSQYGASKLAGEQQIESLYGEKSLVMRTAWLYGPFGKNFAKTILKKALTTQDEIRVVDDQFGQPTSTLDLATQIYKTSINKLPSGIYHATNSGEATWYEFAREIVALSGEPKTRVKPIKSSEYPKPAKRPGYSVLDHSKWKDTAVAEMGDWKSALIRAFPAIKREVDKELGLG